MKFVAQEDIEAPIDAVFDAVSDFESFERSAMRRGADVVRTDGMASPAVGMGWRGRFKFRGRERDVQVVLARYDRPNGMTFDSIAQGMTGQFLIDLVPLSRSRTRMIVTLDLTPQTLSAKLFVQSMKLARNKLAKRYKKRVAVFAEGLEERHRRSA